MGKMRIKPRIDDKGTRLLEVKIWRMTKILCLRCYRLRQDKYKHNTTSRYQGRPWHHAPYPFEIIAQPAGWEKVVCADCGRKNHNPNQSESRSSIGTCIV